MAKTFEYNKKGERVEIITKNPLGEFRKCKALKYDGEDHIFNFDKCKKCKHGFKYCFIRSY